MGLKTEELTKVLKNTKDVESYLHTEENFVTCPVEKALMKLLVEKDQDKARVIKAAGLEHSYGYQIFNGTRRPNRDKLLCLAVGLGLNDEETQNLLKQTGFQSLYARDRRDAVILFGLINSMTVMEINTLLFDHKERTLL